MKNAKQKGRALEKHVCDRIRSFGLDPKAIYDGASGAGTREKADIRTSMKICERTVGIECKNFKKPHIKVWWEQAQKLQTLDREPILVYKLGGEKYEETKAVVYLDTLLELIASKQEGELLTLDKTIQWKIKKLKDAASELFKSLK